MIPVSKAKFAEQISATDPIRFAKHWLQTRQCAIVVPVHVGHCCFQKGGSCLLTRVSVGPQPSAAFRIRISTRVSLETRKMPGTDNTQLNQAETETKHKET